MNKKRLNFKRFACVLTSCFILCFSCFGLFDLGKKNEPIQASAEEVPAFVDTPFVSYTVVIPAGLISNDFLFGAGNTNSIVTFGREYQGVLLFGCAVSVNFDEYFILNDTSLTLTKDLYMPVCLGFSYFDDYFSNTTTLNWISVFCGEMFDEYTFELSVGENHHYTFDTFYVLRSFYTSTVGDGSYQQGFTDGYLRGESDGFVDGLESGYSQAVENLNIVMRSFDMSSCYVDIIDSSSGILVGSFPFVRLSSTGSGSYTYFMDIDLSKIDNSKMYHVYIRFSPFFDLRNTLWISTPVSPVWSVINFSLLNDNKQRVSVSYGSNGFTVSEVGVSVGYTAFNFDVPYNNGYNRIEYMYFEMLGSGISKYSNLLFTNRFLYWIYDSGFDLGENKGYSTGFTQGNTSGYTTGYTEGLTKGLQDADLGSFLNLATAVVDAPIRAFLGLVDFEILGMNMRVFFLSLLTGALVIAAFRLFSGGA